MNELDIGCGFGFMNQTIVGLDGSDGKVIAIDNNKNQINAASAGTPDTLNIVYKVHDIYELDSLDQKFDRCAPSAPTFACVREQKGRLWIDCVIFEVRMRCTPKVRHSP
jgi:ubiquinone/menaquinone biosynthesis C-methylase UbiE